jgi:hypothetical protein
MHSSLLPLRRKNTGERRPIFDPWSIYRRPFYDVDMVLRSLPFPPSCKMPSPADTSAVVQGDDEYQYLWYMLQELQTTYGMIDWHFQKLRGILFDVLGDSEAGKRWHKVLQGLSQFWRRGELSMGMWTRDKIQHRTFERFSQTMRAAYILLEVRREFDEFGTVTFQTMAERMLRIGRLMAVEVPGEGIEERVRSLQTETNHALEIWEEVKVLLRIEDAEQESDTTKLQLQACHFRPAATSDLPPETTITGCNTLEQLEFSAHSSAPFTCQPPLCSTLATRSLCFYAPDGTRLKDKDFQERHEDYDSTALESSLREGYFPSVTFC